MVSTELAPVRPRAVDPDGGVPRLLEEEVEALVARRETRPVCVCGAPGAGRTVALRHLAAVLPRDTPVVLLDGPDQAEVSAARGSGRLVVYFARQPCSEPCVVLRLAPWTEDDWIEYLLARHPDQCARVFEIVRCCGVRSALSRPDLCVAVLEQLAGDDRKRDVDEAIHDLVAARLGARAYRTWRGESLRMVLSGGAGGRRYIPRGDPSRVRVCWHPAVQTILAADRIAEDVSRGRFRSYWAHRFPDPLIAALVRALRRWGVSDLDRFGKQTDAMPMLASVALAADPAWRPRHPPRNLRYARLRRADWPDADLRLANLTHVDLREARLRGAWMDWCSARFSKWGGAQLAGASLKKAVFDHADLSGVELTQSAAVEASFSGARLDGARAEGADLSGADLAGASLAGAALAGGKLRGARLGGARLDGADLRWVDLSDAVLAGVDLRSTDLHGALLANADLSGCNLEGLEVDDLAAEGASFASAMLTGSSLPGADLRVADLRSAGLADVRWQGADLAGANFWGAMFHMGSSRSGLVGSTVAGEGSRTGFYTDEYHEQCFRPPEEIRKADLRGVDLRGAFIEGADFYLVDLRGARYHANQAAHLRRTGAIL